MSRARVAGMYLITIMRCNDSGLRTHSCAVIDLTRGAPNFTFDSQTGAEAWGYRTFLKVISCSPVSAAWTFSVRGCRVRDFAVPGSWTLFCCRTLRLNRRWPVSERDIPQVTTDELCWRPT